MKIGCSTVIIRRTRLSQGKRIIKIKEAGANAVEINLRTYRDVYTLNLPKVKKQLAGFDYVSIHAPYFNTNYTKNPDKIINQLAKICFYLKADGIVFHGHLLNDKLKMLLKKSNMPILIENMDLKQTESITAEQMLEIKIKQICNMHGSTIIEWVLLKIWLLLLEIK